MNTNRSHMKKYLLLITGLLLALTGTAQNTGMVRGVVLSNQSGEPVIFTNVYLEGTIYGTITDENGFYSIPAIPKGTYNLMATGIGYDTVRVSIQIGKGEIINKQLFLNQVGVQLGGIDVTAERIEKLTEIYISTVKATPKDIKRIPSVGGEADLAQYLSIIPGIITTGDQGGQLYIRGGAPIQNKILLDGLTIYNAFHSIGLFSVYETEIIRNVEVLTGGFNAEYGGRISAVVDVTTRDGNKQKFSGTLSGNPFVSKILLEGPISKLSKAGSSISYILTGKKSYLQESSKLLYNYAGENPPGTDQVLPYNFTDLYGKLSFNAADGSKLSLTGFNYADRVDFSPVAKYQWDALGIGSKFVIVPGQSQTLISGNLDYSDYRMELSEADEKPRFSSISGFNLGMDFTYFLEGNSELKYGVDINGFSTKFEFYNSLGLKLDQNQNTTEIGGYVKYRKVFPSLVIEPSFRLQYYASLANVSPEPRLGLKYNASERLRLKFAGGFYSQNLISTKSDKDVVNLFTGFLSGPEEQFKGVDGKETPHKLQKATHAILGFEYDLTEDLEINVEGYVKDFTQMINLNRNKVFRQDPNYMVETGKAYGADLLLKYETDQWYLWTTYSLGFVTRYDGEQTYPPHYDRRHNVNILLSYLFGNEKSWEATARWNLGSGFPFTKTQAFYEEVVFTDGVNTNYTTQNGNLGIIYDETINAGRLPYYHRLDISLKKTIHISKTSLLNLIASVSNVYNRDNIFYFDRVRYERVNQLPLLPSIGFSFSF